jgi:hypothetical protein
MEIYKMGQTKTIHTEYIYPPIPDRRYDWQAVRDDYEPGMPIGMGYTELDAVKDLIEQELDEKEKNTLKFTKESLEELKELYEKNKDSDVLVFMGREFMPNYAKYLIQYLEMEFYGKDPYAKDV